MSVLLPETQYTSPVPYTSSQSVLLDPNQVEAARRLSSLDRLRQQAAALNLADVEGTGARGFLTGALDYLGRPSSAVLAALTPGVEGQPADPFSRFLAGLSGDLEVRGSDIVGAPSADASVVERLLRGAAGFGIDVAADPLTYLTLGRGGTLRGAGAARAAEAQVGRAAREVIPPVSQAITPPTVGVGTAAEAAMQRAQGGIRSLTDQPVVPMGAGRVTPTLSRREVSPVEAAGVAPTIGAPELPTFMGRRRGTEEMFPGATEQGAVATRVAPEVSEVDDFVQRIASAAAEGQIIGGGRGMRDSIQRVLRERYDPETAASLTSRILSSTTGEVRGGVGIRVPFLGRDRAGNIVPAREAETRRLVDLTPGGGEVLDNLGLRGFAEGSRKVFNQYRSTSMYQGWSRLMNGRFGAEYAAVIKNATGKGGLTYDEYSKLVGAQDRMLRGLAARDETASLLLVTAKNMLDKATSPEEARKAAEEYLQMGDNMVLRAGASESERVGFEVASSLRSHGENMFDELVSEAGIAGVEVGNLRNFADNYIPRPLSAEEIARRKAAGVDASAYSAQDPRQFGFEYRPDGTVRSLSAAEMNQRLGRKVFEIDPLKVAAQQYASYSEFIGRLALVSDLKKTGMITQVSPETLRFANVKKIDKRLEKYRGTIEGIVGRLEEMRLTARSQAEIDRIDNALAKIAGSDETINTILGGIVDTSPDSLKAVGNLVRAMKSGLQAAEEAGIPVSAGKKYKLLSRNNLIQERVTTTRAEAALAEGLVSIGADRDVRMPKGMSNMFASSAVRDAVEKYFKVESKGTGVVRDFFDNFYMPYYTLFKTYATIGRPGGYHVRNLIGAAWNNYLGDVSAGDHKLSGIVLAGIKTSNDTARKAVENVLAGKASGLVGDEDKLAQYVAGLARGRSSNVIDYEVDQLANFILMRKLDKIKVGDRTLSDVFAAATDQGVMRSNRALNEIRMEARAEGADVADVLQDPNFINLFRGKSRAELGKVQNALNKTANWSLLRYSAQASDISENYVRLAAFISGARSFGLADGGQAANYLVKGLHFDYQDLSDFERQVLKNIIPFYVWTRRNVPLQLWSLFNQPGKFNKLGFAQDELQTQFGADGDDEAMAGIVPEWMRNKLGFVTNITGPSGAPLVFGLESPALDLNRYLTMGSPTQALESSWKEAVSASNPLFKALIEGATGVDTFTGVPFSDKGEPVPFMIPGIGFRGETGETMVPSQAINMATDLLPPLGVLNRLSGRGGQQERLLTNYLSQFTGAPVSTLTPRQQIGEIRAREERLAGDIDRQINEIAFQLNIDAGWLSEAVRGGYTLPEIISFIEQGFAPRPAAG